MSSLKTFSEFYEASIRYDRPLNSEPIISVSATDADSGDAGEVEYQLQESSSLFSIGISDGGIRLTSFASIGKFNSITSYHPQDTQVYFILPIFQSCVLLPFPSIILIP